MLRLPRLPIGWERQPPEIFQRYWQEAMEAIEVTLNAIIAIPEIEAALAGVDAATAAAQAAADAASAAAANAQTAADTAQGATDANAQEGSLINSGIINITAPPLLAADSAGGITISTHDRRYGDSTLNPTVTVNGSVLSTSYAPGDTVYIYYDDPTRAGDTVTYQTSLAAADAVQGGNRHSIGGSEIPAIGSQDGNYVRPPGVVEPRSTL